MGSGDNLLHQQPSSQHQSQKSEPASTQPQKWLQAGIRGWGLATLTLHALAYNLPPDLAWSVWPYTFLPAWLGWSLALLTGLLIVPAVNHRLLKLLAWLPWPPPAHRQPLWFGLIAVLAGGLFWLARLRHLRWGDGYLLSIALSYPDPALRVIYNWQAPFTVFLHQRLWQFVANPLLGWPVETVYATVSILCGMAFVYLLLTFAAQLGRDWLETAVLASLVLTTGAVQLFFGYVENYTVVSLLLLLTMFLAWRSLAKGYSLWQPMLALSLTNAFHPSTVFLWPAMGLLALLYQQQHQLSLQKTMLYTILPPLLIGSSVLALMESGGHGLQAFLGVDRPGGGDGIWFVPLFETTTQWQRYTMFSVAHFLDWANIHFLSSPAGLPLLILILLSARRRQQPLFTTPAERRYGYFLGAAAAMYILLTWLWNPDYGGQKDWDLFAPSAFVYTLLSGYLLVRALPDRQRLRESSLFIVAVSLLHTAAWIYANTHFLPHD